MFMRQTVFWVVLALGFPIAGQAAEEGMQSPTERVRIGVNKVIAILQDKTLGREARQVKIREIIDDGFDFQSMSQSVLATNWKGASSEERRRFVSFFSEYLENTYMASIESYTDQTIRYTGEKIRGDRAIVDSEIVTDTADIPITYKLKLNEGSWFAYDVVIEGVSLVSNYRTTFAAILRTEGMDGLLSDLQNKIDHYKATQKTGSVN
jgi:phospholipid transport system substrate-binding protein